MDKVSKQYPYGKLIKQDEGEMALAVYVEGNAVRVDFGKPVLWIGLPPEQARGLAALLVKHAEQIEQARQ